MKLDDKELLNKKWLSQLWNEIFNFSSSSNENEKCTWGCNEICEGFAFLLFKVINQLT